MDIFLVNAPVNIKSEHSGFTPPLGLAYIGAVLLQNGFSVLGLDFNLYGYNLEHLEKALKDNPPAILGISSYTETYINGLKLAEAAKKLLPDIKVVFGGPHASVMYKEVTAEKNVDIVVRGEGEYAMLELASFFIRGKGSLHEIRGISYKDGGKIAVTPDRPFIEDPDTLPFPARSLFPFFPYREPFSVLASRGGCPFGCHFCAVNNIWKGRRRYRKPENVLKEIAASFDASLCSEFVFADDAFTMDRDFTEKLCKLLAELARFTGFTWSCGTRVDLVDEELLKEMYKAGCNSIQYGIEAGSQKILDSIGKKITVDQVRKAVRMTLDAGIGVTCFFMFPHPEDTEETVREQKNLMEELNEMGAYISLATTSPFPGTYYYEHAAELGIKILASDWNGYDCKHIGLTTRYLSLEKLQELLQEIISDLGMKQKQVWT